MSNVYRKPCMTDITNLNYSNARKHYTVGIKTLHYLNAKKTSD